MNRCGDSNHKKMKKVTMANPEALTRLRAIEAYQEGKTQREVAEEFGIHQTTVGEWVKMYEKGGAEALKVPLKPRQKHELNENEIHALLQQGVDGKSVRKLAALLELAHSKKLNHTAQNHDVTPQALMKWRRQFLKNEIPKTITH